MYDKYISTTLPYANSSPHMGHAWEFILADAIVKYHRCVEHKKVFFNVGLDEHGLKVHTHAQSIGYDTQTYLDQLADEWKQFCATLEIKYDNFYRTSSETHRIKVQEFWMACKDDFYSKTYTGLYCVGCEAFKTPSDLIGSVCPDHHSKPITTEETNWFFRYSKYKDKLLAWLDDDFLLPTNKLSELRNIIANGEDISVSRLKKNVPWGIEIPDDPEQVIYVWVEALMNYIFAVDDFRSETFIQLCGPDNLRFQGSLFQAILESQNLPHTAKLLVHGTILDSLGRKMSKTVGNVIDPLDQIKQYGLDAVRYYTLAGLSTYQDNNWNQEKLVAKYNSDLADDYGNLLARVVALMDKFNITEIGFEDKTFFGTVTTFCNDIESLWRSYRIDQALDQMNGLLKFGNKYLTEAEPWKTKDIKPVQNVYVLLRAVTHFYQPVLSSVTYNRIIECLSTRKKAIIFPKKEVLNG
jgi:methionyl-tRNA synthetase